MSNIYRPEEITLYLCTHGTASGVVEFHERDDDDPEGQEDCPPCGCASLLLLRGQWEDLGTPAEIQVTLSVRDGAPRLGDGGDYIGWTRRFPSA